MMHGDMQDVSFVKKRHNRNPPNRTQQRVNTPKPRPPTDSYNLECKYCGRRHAKRDCPAYGQICRKCGKKKHFQAKCRATTSTVRTTEEIFFVGLVGDSASKAVIAVTVGSSKPNSQVQFQMDTGSECNVLLPFKTIEQNNRGSQCEEVTPLYSQVH